MYLLIEIVLNIAPKQRRWCTQRCRWRRVVELEVRLRRWEDDVRRGVGGEEWWSLRESLRRWEDDVRRGLVEEEWWSLRESLRRWEDDVRRGRDGGERAYTRITEKSKHLSSTILQK